MNRLKKGAIKTAENWISWEESSKKFYETVKKLSNMDSPNQEAIETRSKFFFDVYVKYETKKEKKKKKIGDYMRNKTPRVYKVYRKIIRK